MSSPRWSKSTRLFHARQAMPQNRSPTHRWVAAPIRLAAGKLARPALAKQVARAPDAISPDL
jgi:hypothetical protein